MHDRGFTGFHRVEYGLWHGEAAASLRTPADALATAVGKLQAVFGPAQLDPLQLSIRAHEITENALQLELTGETDEGSHSNLATVAANLQGTREVLSIIKPLLASRYPQLPAVESDLASTESDLQGLRTAAGFPALSALSRTQRERIDSDLSELAERLAPIATILEPRRAS